MSSYLCMLSHYRVYISLSGDANEDAKNENSDAALGSCFGVAHGAEGKKGFTGVGWYSALVLINKIYVSFN